MDKELDDSNFIILKFIFYDILYSFLNLNNIYFI